MGRQRSKSNAPSGREPGGETGADLQRQRVEPRHPDDVEPGSRQASGSTEQNIPDARRGREYQGSGILNRGGRFGSSEKPADLEHQPAKRRR